MNSKTTMLLLIILPPDDAAAADHPQLAVIDHGRIGKRNQGVSTRRSSPRQSSTRSSGCISRAFVIAIASFLGLGLGVTDSAARCLRYEPAQVALVGTLASRYYPGPPNYHSIAKGDHPEAIFILTLDEPICVSGDPSSRLNSKSHSRVTEVQLATSGRSTRRFLNKRVRASGSFFGAHTGHHRTPVVLTVVGLRAALDAGDPAEPSSSDDASSR